MSGNMTRLLIKDHKVISWNDIYQCKHWTKRKRLADEVHMLVRTAITLCSSDLKFPIDVTIRAYKKGRTIDSDNICIKLYVDGLKGEWIPDDDIKYIGWAKGRSYKGKEDWVEITLTESVDD